MMAGIHYRTHMQLHVLEENKCELVFKIEWYRARSASILNELIRFDRSAFCLYIYGKRARPEEEYYEKE